MKKTFLVLTALAASSPALWAAQSEYIYVTNRAAGIKGVTVLKHDLVPTNPPVLIKTIDDPSFQQANGIIAVPSRRRLYVSNAGANPGTISVINGDTLLVETVYTVAGSQQLTGMSLSADDTAIYVAGLNPTPVTGGPTVWRVSLVDGTSSIAGSVADPGRAALDCAVIKASAVGGSGNAAGKLFFSVPNSTPFGYIGVVDILGGGAFSSISTGTAGPPLDLVSVPGRMDRSPDHSVLYIACDNIGNTGSRDAFLHVIRVDTASNAASDVQIQNNVVSLPYTTLDVSFRPETAAMKAYVLGNNNGTINLYLLDSAGGVAPGAPSLNPPPNAGTVVQHLDGAGNDFAYLGDAAVGTNAFARFDVAAWPPTQLGNGSSGGNGTTRFAFMTAPAAPTIGDTCPKGDVNVAGNTLIIHGSNFQTGATVQLPTGTLPLTLTTVVIDAQTLQCTTASGALTGELNVTVVNPDSQQAVLRQFYCTTGAGLTPWTMTLPSVSTGYQMLSVPQYSSISSLQAALQTALGPYDPSVYRVFFWDGTTYTELDSMTNDCDLAGRAFWVITRFGGMASVSGLDCFANAVNGTRAIPLKPGWNMVSLPYQKGVQQSMLWTNVQVTADGSIWNPSFAADNLAQTLSNPLLYQFVNGAYVTTNVMRSGQGYWVENLTASTIYLLFTNSNVFKPGAGPVPTYASLAAGSPQPPPPPGSSVGSGSSSGGGGGGCGLLGLELLPVALAFHGFRRRRRLGA